MTMLALYMSLLRTVKSVIMLINKPGVETRTSAFVSHVIKDDGTYFCRDVIQEI